MNDRVQFWEFVARRSVYECWYWAGDVDKRTRFGVYQLDNNKEYAHVLAWEMFYGRDMHNDLHHTCYNTLCVNPFHIEEDL